jgi:C4-dicarboxylate transporter, DctQ subunit
MEILKKFNQQLTQVLLVVAAVLAFLLCFLVVTDVIGRVVFNSPVKGTTEIVSLSIVVICYLQAGFAIRSGGMLHVDMFVSKAGPRGQSIMSAIAGLAGLAFFRSFALVALKARYMLGRAMNLRGKAHYASLFGPQNLFWF